MREGPVTVSRREYAALNAAVGGENDDVHRWGISSQGSAKHVPQQPHPAYWTLLCAANVAAQAGHVRVVQRLCQLVGHEDRVLPRCHALHFQLCTVNHVAQLSMARWLLIANTGQNQPSVRFRPSAFHGILTGSSGTLLWAACSTGNLELLQYYFSEADAEHRSSQREEECWYLSAADRLRFYALVALVHGQVAVLRWLMSSRGLTPEQLGAVWSFGDESNALSHSQAPRRRPIRVPRGATGDASLLATLRLLVEELRLPWPDRWIMSYDLGRWVHVRHCSFVNMFTLLHHYPSTLSCRMGTIRLSYGALNAAVPLCCGRRCDLRCTMGV
jgi:hypothetical protein